MEPTTSELLRILASRMCDAEAAIKRIEKACVFGDSELQKRSVILEGKIEAMAGDVRSASQITNELDGLAARFSDMEYSLKQAEQARRSIPHRAADNTDDAGGQWGIGDIILAAERVEVRKASKPGASPVICAWFDDPAQARSLARYVGAEVRFDEFTNHFTVTFEATRVI